MPSPHPVPQINYMLDKDALYRDLQKARLFILTNGVILCPEKITLPSAGPYLLEITAPIRFRRLGVPNNLTTVVFYWFSYVLSDINAEDLKAFPAIVMEKVIKALKLNSKEARLKFPRLLQIVEKYQKETLCLMVQEVSLPISLNKSSVLTCTDYTCEIMRFTWRAFMGYFS